MVVRLKTTCIFYLKSIIEIYYAFLLTPAIMQKIKVWEIEITLDIAEELTIKNLRKIYPIIQKNDGNEIEMIVWIVKALAVEENVEEILDGLSIAQFTELSEQITPLLDTQKKTKK